MSSDESGRWYRDHWREKVMQLVEASAKEVKDLSTDVVRHGERLDAINQKLAWLFGGIGAVLAAVGVWLLNKL